MNLPELFRNPQKENDPDRIPSWHEISHAIVHVSFGLLPEYTSLNGYRDNIAFNSNTFYGFWDVGVDWEKEGSEYALMSLFGGIIGSAFYSGIYDWSGARSDMKAAEFAKEDYSLRNRQVMAVWLDCHYLIEDNSDLLEQAAEKLFRDKVLGWEYWESVLLTPMNELS